jgi:hypothetical protein
MKKFLLLYMGPMSGEDQMKIGNPEAQKKETEKWTAWYDKANTSVVDFGNPLGDSVHFGNTQHPKSEAKVGGYTIIQAEDIEKAKELVSDHPHLSMPKSCIEIFEMLEMPKM